MPSAWDIEEVRKNRILLATLCPVDYSVAVSWMKAYSALQLPPNSDRMWVSGFPFDEGRNYAVKQCLDSGYQYLAFLDADNIPEQPDCFLRLQQTGLPLVAGAYRQRFPPFRLAAFMAGKDKDGNEVAVSPPDSSIDWNGLNAMDYIPTGVMLIKREVLEALIKEHKTVFEWTMSVLSNPFGRSEDYTACARAKALGYQPYLDCRVRAYHITAGRVKAQDGQIEFGLL